MIKWQWVVVLFALRLASVSAVFPQDTFPVQMDLTGDGRIDPYDLLRLRYEWYTPATAGNPLDFRPDSSSLSRLSQEWHLQSTRLVNPHTGLDEVILDLPGLPPNALRPTMVHIPAGTFTMGSAVLSGLGEEWPAHPVSLTQDFYIGKFEVTQAQWQAVMGTNPVADKPNREFPIQGIGPNISVVYVSWSQCQEFISRLNQLGLGEFRLPTEAEWEYACRAGTQTAYSHGEGSTCSGDGFGRCPEHEPFMWWAGLSPSTPRRVGTKLPNPWGLFDVHGNVYEWCSDYWLQPIVGKDPRIDPKGPATGSNRVFRGGSWASSSINCRSTVRLYMPPALTDQEIGLRLAASAVAG